MVGDGHVEKIFLLKDENVLKDTVSICLCACGTVLCTVKLRNTNSFLGHYTAWAYDYYIW